MSENNRRTTRANRPSFVWPVILVILGLIFLFNNLGILRGDIWQSIWRLWPVIFIAIGLDGLFRRNEIAGPVFMVVLGSVFLLNSIEMIGWETWDVLWRLWPVMLVAVGIEIILGRRSLWISLLATVVILAALGAGIYFLGGVSFTRGTPLTEESIHQVWQDIDQAEVSLRPAVGRLTVSGAPDSAELISGSFRTNRYGNVYADYEVQGRTGRFVMQTQPMVNFPGGSGWVWDLALTDQLPLDLEIAMGVGELNTDLSILTLSAVDISQGVGDLTVNLAEKASYSGDISQAIGKIVVRIPRDAGVRIQVSRAITSLAIPSEFEQRGDYYYSPNYELADNKVDLEISQAIGSIEVIVMP